MANNRFQLKQFAGNASNNGVFGSFSAGASESSSDPETIQSLPAWLNGWLNATTSASILPRLEEMQGVQFVLCKAILENYKEGLPSWLSTETYYQYSMCGYADETHVFNVYINTTGNFTTTNPAQDTTNWKTFANFFNLATPKVFNQKANTDLSNLTSNGKNVITAPFYRRLSNIVLEAPNGIITTQSNWIDWTQPVYTSDTSYGTLTLNSGQMQNMWQAFDGNQETFASVIGTDASATFTLTYPTKKKVSNIYICNVQEDGSWQGLGNMKVYAINNGRSTLLLDLSGSGATTNIWNNPIGNVICDALQFVATRPSTKYGSIINTITVMAQSLEPNTLVVKHGIKVLLPNGFNHDGTPNSIEWTLPYDQINVIGSFYAQKGFIAIYQGGTSAFSFELLRANYFPDPTTFAHYGLYRVDLNKTYRTNLNGSRWEWVEMPFVVAVNYSHSLGQITDYQVNAPARLTTINEAFNAVRPNYHRAQSFSMTAHTPYYMPFDGFLYVNGANYGGWSVTVDGLQVYFAGASGSKTMASSNILFIPFGAKIQTTFNIGNCWLAPAVGYEV